MALIVSGSAHDAVARRRARKKDTTLYLRVDTVPVRTGDPHLLTVGWAPRRLPRGVVKRQVGDVVVCLGPRVARYTQWRDLTIAAWRLGPLEFLTVKDAPLALLELREWERTHRGLLGQPAA